MSALDERSKYLRRLIVRALEGGNRGHAGASMSLVEIMRVLYDDLAGPDDRIILSKGHGCLAQYALLADHGSFPLKWLDSFCRLTTDGITPNRLGGHPDAKVPGIWCTTGSLGHGLPVGVGMALARPQHRVFVVMGDGELGEGSVWEAAMHASKHRLGNLTAIIDVNGLQSAGFCSAISGESVTTTRFQAFGWRTRCADGHNLDDLRHELAWTGSHAMPLAVVAWTVKGKGIPFAEHNLAWHHRNSFSPEEIAAMKEAFA